MHFSENWNLTLYFKNDYANDICISKMIMQIIHTQTQLWYSISTLIFSNIYFNYFHYRSDKDIIVIPLPHHLINNALLLIQLSSFKSSKPDSPQYTESYKNTINYNCF